MCAGITFAQIGRMGNAEHGKPTTEHVDGPSPIGAARAAREAGLVETHVALVDYAVAQLAARLPRHVPRDELVSAAMAGLAQAARSFDPGRDTRFDQYASARIRGALLDELRSRDWASRSVRAKARRLASVQERLTNDLGRMPTTSELADELGVEAGSVDAVNADVHRSVILNYDSVLADIAADALLPSDEVTPDAVLMERERRSYLLDAVAALPNRLRHVVVSYFFEERPMQEIASELGVSPSRISQMRAEAIAMLKDGLSAHLDPDELAGGPADSPRVARRKAAYVAAVGAGSGFHERLSASTGSAAIRLTNR